MDTKARIVALRAELGATQAEAAAMFGVGRRTYQDWERGVAETPGPAVKLLEQWEDPQSARDALERARRERRTTAGHKARTTHGKGGSKMSSKNRRVKRTTTAPTAAQATQAMQAETRLEVPHVSGPQVVFGIPAMPQSAVPERFQRDDEWKWAERLFFRGSAGLIIKAKPGIDGAAAARAVKATLASFESKHEHKMATVAYMLDEWFDVSES